MFFARSCCCTTCTIWSDDFATDQLATAYDTRSGSFSVGSGVLTTTSAPGLLIADATGTFGHGKSQVTGKVSAFGASFRAVGSYVDDSTYVFAEVTVNNGANASTVKLWSRSGGSNTQLGTTFNFTGALNTNYTVGVCWTGTKAVATTSVGSSPNLDGAYTGTGDQAGVGASAAGGTVTLDDFSFTNLSADVPGCSTCVPANATCTHCEDSEAPGEVQVVITGSTDNTCGSCEALDGTYTLAYAGNCTWTYIFPSSPGCSAFSVYFRFDFSTRLAAGINPSGPGYQLDVSSPYDCLGISGLNLPDDGLGALNSCQGGTCTVTAL